MFSQDSINNYFDKRSSHRNKLIGETLDDICEGRCSVHDIPNISVMKRDGKWVSADNRRLWVFRELERLGQCDEILVHQTFYIDSRKLNSYNGGVTVHVRRYAGGRWHNKPSVTRPETKKPSTAISPSQSQHKAYRTSQGSQEEVRPNYMSPTSWRNLREDNSLGSLIGYSSSSSVAPNTVAAGNNDAYRGNVAQPTSLYSAGTSHTSSSSSNNTLKYGHSPNIRTADTRSARETYRAPSRHEISFARNDTVYPQYSDRWSGPNVGGRFPKSVHQGSRAEQTVKIYDESVNRQYGEGRSTRHTGTRSEDRVNMFDDFSGDGNNSCPCVIL